MSPNKNPIKLHVGCGLKHLEGYINIDVSPEVKPDVVADICKLPFKDNSVDEIYTAHTLEHVPDFTKAMRELHRVLRPGGRLKIVVPYPASLYAFIPQHVSFFAWDSFIPFKKGTGFVVEHNSEILNQTQKSDELIEMIEKSGFTIINLPEVRRNDGNIFAVRE